VFVIVIYLSKCGCHVLCREIGNALLNVMNAVVNMPVIDYCWIFSVPLYHLLSNTVKPFSSASGHSSASHRKPEWWGIADFEKLVEKFKRNQGANM